MSSLAKRVGITSVLETPEFKNIENLILEAHSRGETRITIINGMPKIVSKELSRQGFLVAKICKCRNSTGTCFCTDTKPYDYQGDVREYSISW